MTIYTVNFFKNLLSSNGHRFKCLQRAIEIRQARNVDRAVQAAERRYARFHRVRDWKLYADDLEVEIDGKKIDSRSVHAEIARARHPGFVRGMHH